MRIHMNNGYYLSTYLHINEVAHLTGMRIRHDQNVSLWHKNGDKIDLVHYWELERITGLKKNNRSLFTVEQARELLRMGRIWLLSSKFWRVIRLSRFFGVMKRIVSSLRRISNFPKRRSTSFSKIRYVN